MVLDLKKHIMVPTIDIRVSLNIIIGVFFNIKTFRTPIWVSHIRLLVLELLWSIKVITADIIF